MNTGTKHDTGKRRFSLLPTVAINAVIDVLEFGARKYAVGNWRAVDDAHTRYFDAAHRHISAWWQGEKNDPESGLPHLAHAICCLVFCLAIDLETSEDQR